MFRVLACVLIVWGSVSFLVTAGDGKDPLAVRQGDWVCQGGGGQLGRDGPAMKLGLPFWSREIPQKITLSLKGDRWTMVHTKGTAKGIVTARKGAKLDEIDLTIDGKDGAKLLGLIVPLNDGKWGFCLNLPGKARPADTVGADLSYYWRPAK